MLKPVFYTVMWAVLFSWSCAIYHQINNDERLLFVNSVSIHHSKWRPMYDPTLVLSAIDQHWDKKCTDLSTLWHPRVTYVNTADTPGCVIHWKVTKGINQELNLVDIPPKIPGCKQGSYKLTLTGGVLNSPANAGIAQVNDFATLNVDSENGTTVSFLQGGKMIGNDFTLRDSEFTDCDTTKRPFTAMGINSAVNCSDQTSPFCTCVHKSTSQLLRNNTVIYITKDNVTKALDNCIRVTRYAYNRHPNDKNSFCTPTMLFVFLFAMFLNSCRDSLVFHLGLKMATQSRFLDFILTSTAAVILILTSSLVNLNHDGEVEWKFLITAFFPALVFHVYWHWIMPSYEEVTAKFVEKEATSSAEHSLLPHIHPFFFDMALCTLMLFTLVARGVVDEDTLFISIIKCHGVTALYIALAWYNIHKRQAGKAAENGLNNIFIEEAYMGMSILAIMASCDHFLIPYATKEGIQLHWFLPLFFVVSSFAPSAWMGTLRQFGLQAGGDLPSTLPFLVGVLALCVMVSSHTVLFGNSPDNYQHSNWATLDVNRMLLRSF
jgi:hypothetical protein